MLDVSQVSRREPGRPKRASSRVSRAARATRRAHSHGDFTPAVSNSSCDPNLGDLYSNGFQFAQVISPNNTTSVFTAWVDLLNIYHATFPTLYPYVTVAAGDDMETDFNTPSPTENWFAGFLQGDLVWNTSSLQPMLIDGPMAGEDCTSPACLGTYGESISRMYPNAWRRADVAYLYGGAGFNYPFPQIYDTNWPAYYANLDAAQYGGAQFI